ncbi:hypothetical protein [Streptomyces sp. NBC_01264]|uniref:hypothetical protein n=1 Tax=Streptomyces sp. NBC_01264 TaxID=2903804 RepID=UPI002255D462|nr:hypothetical protein [Streptomyces sp. NBC_01264]MCX4779500.1 hypothetical protein [Streptomyces sp. NBC_01264]
MEKIFVFAHGTDLGGQKVGVPPGFHICVYADPGEVAMFSNGCAAINSGGAIGSRKKFEKNGESMITPYIFSPLEKHEVDRVRDSISSATGGVVYIHGLQELSQGDMDAGVKLLKAPTDDYIMKRLFTELVENHGTKVEYHLHLVACLAPAHPDGENAPPPKRTLAVGNEKKRSYDDTPLMYPETYPEEDERLYPQLHRKSRKIQEEIDRDPSRTLRGISKATLAQMGLGYDEKEKRQISLSPVDPKDFSEVGVTLFPDVLKGAALPDSYEEAHRLEQARCAFGSYLNLAAHRKGEFKETFGLLALYDIISTLPGIHDTHRITCELELEEFMRSNLLLWGSVDVEKLVQALAERRLIMDVKSKHLAENNHEGMNPLADFYGIPRSEFKAQVEQDPFLLESRTLNAEMRSQEAIASISEVVLARLNESWITCRRFILVIVRTLARQAQQAQQAQNDPSGSTSRQL